MSNAALKSSDDCLMSLSDGDDDDIIMQMAELYLTFHLWSVYMMSLNLIYFYLFAWLSPFFIRRVNITTSIQEIKHYLDLHCSYYT